MAELVRVAVDAMGGDNAPTEIIKGVVEAVHADERVKVFLAVSYTHLRAHRRS